MIELIETIETKDAIIYGALAINLLLLLRISARVRRIMRLIEPRKGSAAPKDEQAGAASNRYMREETLAEFLQRQRDGG